MSISMLFLLFIIYSFCGWLMEVSCKLVEQKKFINRGFLIGPYCPIYGWGCLLMIILLKKYIDDPIALFVMSIVICSILEYFTSYIMEKVFNARWWDYSKRKYNINGRICLETMIPFGILGCIVMYFINPFFVSMLSLISINVINVLAVIIFIIFIIDNVISFSIILNFKKISLNIAKDSTEEITKKVREVLSKKSMLGRRLINAYPHVQSKIKKIREKLK